MYIINLILNIKTKNKILSQITRLSKSNSVKVKFNINLRDVF